MTAEAILGKIQYSRALNVTLYDASGNPVILISGKLPIALFDSTGGSIAFTGGRMPSSIYDSDGNKITNFNQMLIDNPTNGYQSTRSIAYTFGRNSSVNNSRVDLWEGPTSSYVFPATAQQMAVSSSSANDTLAGTGIQKLMIHYLDDSYVQKEESVSLDGVTPVNTVATNILRINRIHAMQVGSSGTSQGNISIKNLAGSVTYGHIAAGYLTARQLVYTVPSGKNFYFSQWQASAGSASGSHFTQIDLRATSHEGNLVSVFVLVDETGCLNNSLIMQMSTPIRIAPMADIKVTAVSDASNANAIVMSSIMGWLEDV